jgi:hypothetical protein
VPLTAGYVQPGTPTIHLHPRVADGSVDLFTGDPERKHTIAHELGHVVDSMKGPNGDTVGPRGRNLGAIAFHQEHKHDQPSEYGKTAPHEGYAEVFAEYMLGKDTPVVRAYAARYGWKKR